MNHEFHNYLFEMCTFKASGSKKLTGQLPLQNCLQEGAPWFLLDFLFFELVRIYYVVHNYV